MPDMPKPKQKTSTQGERFMALKNFDRQINKWPRGSRRKAARKPMALLFFAFAAFWAIFSIASLLGWDRSPQRLDDGFAWMAAAFSGLAACAGWLIWRAWGRSKIKPTA